MLTFITVGADSFLSLFSRFIGIPVPTFWVKPWKIIMGDAYVMDPLLRMASIMTCTWKTGMFCQLECICGFFIHGGQSALQ